MELTPIPKSWYAPIVLGLALIITSLGWADSHKTLVRERAEHAVVVQQFKDAQAEANRKAEAKRVELEKKAKEDATKADGRYNTLLTEYRSNLLRFKANQSTTVGSNRGELQTSEGTDRSGSSTDVLKRQAVGIADSSLVISMKDAEICAVNTARLQAAHDWATEYIKSIE